MVAEVESVRIELTPKLQASEREVDRLKLLVHKLEAELLQQRAENKRLLDVADQLQTVRLHLAQVEAQKKD